MSRADVQTQLIVPQLKNDLDSVSFPAVSLPSSSKSKAPLKSLSNPAQALAHLEKHHAKLANLPEEKRKEIEERERWAKAEERAKGGKVGTRSSATIPMGAEVVGANALGLGVRSPRWTIWKCAVMGLQFITQCLAAGCMYVCVLRDGAPTRRPSIRPTGRRLGHAR